MILKALIATGALSVVMTAATMYFSLQAKYERQRADMFEENNETLRRDMEAHMAASDAYRAAIEAMDRSAVIAARELERARKADATLDRCLSYDPGVDLTGGLLRFDEAGNPDGR